MAPTDLGGLFAVAQEQIAAGERGYGYVFPAISMKAWCAMA